MWDEKTAEPINERDLDMKFVYWKKDRDFINLKPTCWVNHNQGEGALTNKQFLAINLEQNLPFTASIFPMKACDPKGHGSESFFPKCFDVTHKNLHDIFFEYYYHCQAESTLKAFC
jgi:hypothetical protein